MGLLKAGLSKQELLTSGKRRDSTIYIRLGSKDGIVTNIQIAGSRSLLNVSTPVLCLTQFY